jgi:hypothetical protein
LRAYYWKVLKIAIKDWKAFWTAHKIITTVPAPVIGFLISAWIIGLRSLISLRQAIEISLLSGLAGFVLTMLLSLVKAPKILHDQQLAEIQAAHERTEELRKALAEQSAHQSRFPPKLEAKVRKFILEHPKSTALFEYLMVQDEWNERQLRCEQDGPALIGSGLLKRRLVSETSALYPSADFMLSIADQYRPIVSQILNEENS